MALFGKREVTAQLTGLAWRRVIQLERRQWEAGRSIIAPPDGARNVQKRTERSLGLVAGTTPGPPDANGMPGQPGGHYQLALGLLGGVKKVTAVRS
jgi:hypothetical protein